MKAYLHNKAVKFAQKARLDLPATHCFVNFLFNHGDLATRYSLDNDQRFLSC